jgi:hypothetical protein
MDKVFQLDGFNALKIAGSNAANGTERTFSLGTEQRGFTLYPGMIVGRPVAGRSL